MIKFVRIAVAALAVAAGVSDISGSTDAHRMGHH